MIIASSNNSKYKCIYTYTQIIKSKVKFYKTHICVNVPYDHSTIKKNHIPELLFLLSDRNHPSSWYYG